MLLLFGFNDKQKIGLLTMANGLSGSVMEAKSSVVHFFSLGQENSKLASENARLQAELFSLREAVRDIQTEKYAKSGVVTARVVDNSIRRDDNYITINRGRRDGVNNGMGVYDSNGVVGIVAITGNNYSIVMPIINRQSSISALIKGENSFGFIEWEGGDPSIAELRDLAYYSNVEVGDTVVTSGYSGIFPKGVEIGVVESVESIEHGYSLRVRVRISSNLSNLDWVYLHSLGGDAELDELFRSLKR